jgi:hypothetical protein
MLLDLIQYRSDIVFWNGDVVETSRVGKPHIEMPHLMEHVQHLVLYLHDAPRFVGNEGLLL